MNIHYVTYFDSGYLPRGVTLIESLRRAGDTSEVVVFALDDGVFQYFQNAKLEAVTAVQLDELEKWEPRLSLVKPERSRAEYIFTLTPHVIRFVMDSRSNAGDVVAYLDADMAFFRTGRFVAEAMDEGSVGIIPHRYPKRLENKLAKYGTYNVGWLGFKNDSDGIQVLNWYSDATIEWCADVPHEGKYADQGYLDQFPRFPGVTVLESAAFNLAPWNTARHDIAIQRDGEVTVDGEPLVFFHYHGLKKWGRRYVTAHSLYRSRISAALRTGVYEPYVQALERNTALVDEAVPPRTVAKRGVGLRGAVFRLVRIAQAILSLLQGNTIAIPNGEPSR